MNVLRVGASLKASAFKETEDSKWNSDDDDDVVKPLINSIRTSRWKFANSDARNSTPDSKDANPNSTNNATSSVNGTNSKINSINNPSSTTNQNFGITNIFHDIRDVNFLKSPMRGVQRERSAFELGGGVGGDAWGSICVGEGKGLRLDPNGTTGCRGDNVECGADGVVGRCVDGRVKVDGDEGREVLERFISVDGGNEEVRDSEGGNGGNAAVFDFFEVGRSIGDKEVCHSNNISQELFVAQSLNMMANESFGGDEIGVSALNSGFAGPFEGGNENDGGRVFAKNGAIFVDDNGEWSLGRQVEGNGSRRSDDDDDVESNAKRREGDATRGSAWGGDGFEEEGETRHDADAAFCVQPSLCTLSEFFTQNDKSKGNRRIPGPAGALPLLGVDRIEEDLNRILMESNQDEIIKQLNEAFGSRPLTPQKKISSSKSIEDQADFRQPAWCAMLMDLKLKPYNDPNSRVELLKTNLKWVHTIGFKAPVPVLVVHIKTLKIVDVDMYRAILRDPSGEYDWNTIYTKGLLEKWPSFGQGCVVKLENTPVVTCNNNSHYLVIRVQNIKNVWPKNSVAPESLLSRLSPKRYNYLQIYDLNNMLEPPNALANSLKQKLRPSSRIYASRIGEGPSALDRPANTNPRIGEGPSALDSPADTNPNASDPTLKISNGSPSLSNAGLQKSSFAPQVPIDIANEGSGRNCGEVGGHLVADGNSESSLVPDPITGNSGGFVSISCSDNEGFFTNTAPKEFAIYGECDGITGGESNVPLDRKMGAINDGVLDDNRLFPKNNASRQFLGVETKFNDYEGLIFSGRRLGNDGALNDKNATGDETVFNRKSFDCICTGAATNSRKDSIANGQLLPADCNDESANEKAFPKNSDYKLYMSPISSNRMSQSNIVGSNGVVKLRSTPVDVQKESKVSEPTQSRLSHATCVLGGTISNFRRKTMDSNR